MSDSDAFAISAIAFFLAVFGGGAVAGLLIWFGRKDEDGEGQA